MGRRGQISLEFLLITGFALLLTLPMTFIFFNQQTSLNSQISATQLEKAANEIRDAVDEVYYLGEPSQKTVVVYFPRGIVDVVIDQGSITFFVTSEGQVYEIVKSVSGNISSDSFINKHDGVHNVVVQAQSFDVLITDS